MRDGALFLYIMFLLLSLLSELSWHHTMRNLEVFFFIAFGVMVACILFVFIPVARWYMDTQKKIRDAVTCIRSISDITYTDDGSSMSSVPRQESIQLAKSDDSSDTESDDSDLDPAVVRHLQRYYGSTDG